MDSTIHRGLAIVVLVLAAACGDTGPVGPTFLPQTPAPVTPPPPRSYPPPEGPSRTFIFERELSYPVTSYTRNSSFVLYDNGALALQYVGFPDLNGGYEQTNGALRFEWRGLHANATATPIGDSLAVEFSDNMQQSDFENAVYVLRR